MKKQILLCIFSFLALSNGWSQNQVVVTPVGEMERAVSGHFAGIVDGKLTTWGGCNFPDIPCADGGQKVFVLVGAFHYVGQDGIISLLQRDGYTVSRVI